MTATLNTNVVDISDSIDLVAQLAEARATIKAAKAAEEAAKKALAKLIGSGVGAVDGIPVVTVTTIDAQRLNITGLQAALPEVAAEYTISYSYDAVKVLA